MNIFSSEFWTVYMLPSAVSLAVFYLIYKGLVRNDTHFKSRRFAILGMLIFAMVLPFLNFQILTNAVIDNGKGVLHTPLQNFFYELPIFTVFAEENAVAETHRYVSPQFFNIIGWIYLITALFLVGRGIVGILRLAAFFKNGKRLPTESSTIISSPNIPTAFSFFKIVFIPETWVNGAEKDMVLAHERVHVNQKHSWDLMLMEAICAVQFFNPFVWLLKREMRLNHEYLADREALKNNENPEQYFQLLLRKIIGKQPILVHPFHYSPPKIKQRIMMQLTKPAKMLNQVRYLAFIPVALALTILFAFKGKSEILETVVVSEYEENPDFSNFFMIVDEEMFTDDKTDLRSAISLNNVVQYVTVSTGAPIMEYYAPIAESDVIEIVTKSDKTQLETLETQNRKSDLAVVAHLKKVDKPKNEEPISPITEMAPEFPGGEVARLKFLREHIRYPAAAQDSNIQGTVYVSFVVGRDSSISRVKIIQGIGGGCDEEVIRVIQNMPNWIPGKMRNRDVRWRFVMPVEFVLVH